MSAYVEVEFDNTDDRFHTGKPNFLLRRTIGQKKDEYTLDRKNATKAEVFQVLESAGFSRSNPYYIVPQGRVTALTNMKDVERLNLLKEISGSNVYETRRTESLKLLGDTDTKRAKIDDLVKELEGRLSELEGERKELEDYNKKDREKRCLLYVLNRQEEIACEEKIAELDQKRQDRMADTDTNTDIFRQNENEIKRIDIEISQLTGQINLLRGERAQLEDDRRDTQRSKAQIELQYKELIDGQSAAQKAKKHHDANLKNIQQQIKEREDELALLLPEYTSKKNEENDLQSQFVEAKSQRQRLEDKQGRTAHYTDKRQRDAALRKEIDQVSLEAATRKALLMDTNEQVTTLEQEIESLEGEIKQLRSTIDNQSDNSLNHATQVQKARDARERLQDQKKELWREEAKLGSQLMNAEQQQQTAERTLSHLLDHNTSRGLQTLERLKTQHRLEGVHGTIAELLTVPDSYKTATEVTAGGSLFHVVCDNDTTATKVVELLHREKGGRLTCIPLNRVKTSNVQLPKAGDAMPLLSKLTYDPAFEPAFKHIFGKTIICPELTICAGYARTHGVNALTPDGDKADKKGSLFGGWSDPSKSRLDAQWNVTRLREEVDKHRSRKIQIRRELDKLEQQITASMSELRKIENQKDQIENSYGPMRQELRAKQNSLQSKRDELAEKQQTASTITSVINRVGDRQNELEAELSSEFKKTLSRDEEQTLVTLSTTVKDLQRKVATLTAARSELENRKTVIELELRENLQPSLDQLLAQESGSNGSSGSSTRLRECERQLKNVNRTLASYNEKIAETESNIEELAGQLSEFEGSKAQKEESNKQLAVAIERHQKHMDNSMQNRAQAMEDLARVQKEIRELGTLPEEAWSTYGKWNTEKVCDLVGCDKNGIDNFYRLHSGYVK